MIDNPEKKQPALIQRIDLGRTGLAFVREELGGGGPLAKCVAGLIQDGDAVFAPLDDGADHARAAALETGTSMPTIAIRQWIADYIGTHWGSKKCQVIFEDTWLDMNTVHVYPPRCPYFLVNATPYYVPQDDMLLAALSAGEKEVASWRYPIFVISPVLPLPSTGVGVETDYLNNLAQNVRAVLISAYDQESYVVWQRM